MTVFYGDSIAFGIANAEARAGRPGRNMGIVGAGLLSEVNMTKVLPGSVPVADSQLASQGNLYDPALIPANQQVVVSFGYNDANTAMASRASQARYLNLATDRLVEIMARAQGQPITLIGLKPLAPPHKDHIPDSNVAGVNTLLDTALKNATQRARASGIPVNAHFLDLTDVPLARLPADGLHYTSAASRTIAQLVRDEVGSPQQPLLQRASYPSVTAALAAAAPVTGQSFTRDEVIAIQSALKNAGFDPGIIDGRQGKNTNIALQNALRAKGFDPGVTDGIIGQNTHTAISDFERQNPGQDDGRLDVAEVRRLLALPNRARSPQTGR